MLLFAFCPTHVYIQSKGVGEGCVSFILRASDTWNKSVSSQMATT